MNSTPNLWTIGKGGMVAPERILAVGLWKSAPVRRMARQAKGAGKLIDLTYGEACQWAIFLDTGYVVLAAGPLPGTFWDKLEAAYENDV
jgi:regulator of extracellular matrix RemA (YlzA/DUF370 family)